MTQAYRRNSLSDEHWALIEPHLPGRAGQWGGVGKDNRRFVNARLESELKDGTWTWAVALLLSTPLQPNAIPSSGVARHEASDATLPFPASRHAAQSPGTFTHLFP